jgi:hypothetical protein
MENDEEDIAIFKFSISCVEINQMMQTKYLQLVADTAPFLCVLP